MHLTIERRNAGGADDSDALAAVPILDCAGVRCAKAKADVDGDVAAAAATDVWVTVAAGTSVAASPHTS
jgi:hypothetical protein